MRAAQTSSLLLAVGFRLRAVRLARHLSLDGVARASGGQVKASALGAYERGERPLSLPRLQDLAEFYDVPVTALLGVQQEQPASAAERPLVVDLEALRRVPRMDGVERLRAFLRAIVELRGDYSGRVLTLRRDDLPAVMALIGVDTREAAFEQLTAWGVLATEASP